MFLEMGQRPRLQKGSVPMAPSDSSKVVSPEQLERLLRRFQESRCPSPLAYSREIREILEHVHAHLFEPELNAKRVLRDCRLRSHNVSCRFRWEVGEGLRHYIESLRMKAAAWVLREHDTVIFDLSMALGYQHEETFYRAFQRRFGCTPSELRDCGAAIRGSDSSKPWPAAPVDRAAVH